MDASVALMAEEPIYLTKCDGIRIYEWQTELWFPTIKAAQDARVLIEEDKEYSLFFVGDGINITSTVVLNHKVGLRIKAYPHTVITFVDGPDRLRPVDEV